MQELGSEQCLQGGETESAYPRLDKLFQNRKHERAVRKNGRTDTIPSTHVHMETLENAKEQRKDVGKAGLKQTVSTRDIVCKRICQSLYELEYLQMYKQRTAGKVWINLNVRLLHNKVCCLLS